MKGNRSEDPSARTRLLRRRSAAAIVVILAIAIVAGCNTLQRSLIYPARHYDRAGFEKQVEERYGGGAAVLAPFDAIVIEPAAAATRTAIWFHGNGNVNTDFGGMVPIFRDRGVRLVLAEYPGYGARAGVPSEHALVDDARSLYAAVAARYAQQPIIVMGQSLGSGVAAQVAAIVDRPVPGRLVLATPFFDLPDAASHAVWGLPLQSLVDDRYDSAAAAVRYPGPLAVVVATDDRLVGAEAGRRLARLHRPHGTTTLVELPGADHDDWLGFVTPATWDALLANTSAVSPAQATH